MGHLAARVVLSCVVTQEEFELEIEETFSVRFVPESQLCDDPDPEAVDEIPLDDGVLALGEAAAEQLALSLPPFPRRPPRPPPPPLDAAPGAAASFAGLAKWRKPG